jgi:DNA-binding response OmpR family regulator
MRILVVEDHDDTRQMLMRLLQHWGFTVAAARTLQNGLSHVEAECFDAIVSDISLPDGTGYALVSEAKRRRKEVLAIALSGHSSPTDLNIGRLAGFDYYLTKPCDCHELRSILAKPRLGVEQPAPAGDRVSDAFE